LVGILYRSIPTACNKSKFGVAGLKSFSAKDAGKKLICV
jgi:hypothetical protein